MKSLHFILCHLPCADAEPGVGLISPEPEDGKEDTFAAQSQSLYVEASHDSASAVSGVLSLNFAIMIRSWQSGAFASPSASGGGDSSIASNAARATARNLEISQ